MAVQRLTAQCSQEPADWILSARSAINLSCSKQILFSACLSSLFLLVIWTVLLIRYTTVHCGDSHLRCHISTSTLFLLNFTQASLTPTKAQKALSNTRPFPQASDFTFWFCSCMLAIVSLQDVKASIWATLEKRENLNPDMMGLH